VGWDEAGPICVLKLFGLKIGRSRGRVILPKSNAKPSPARSEWPLATCASFLERECMRGR